MPLCHVKFSIQLVVNETCCYISICSRALWTALSKHCFAIKHTLYWNGTTTWHDIFFLIDVCELNYIEGLMQERCNSIAIALELHLSSTNLSICWFRITVPPLLRLATLRFNPMRASCFLLANSKMGWRQWSIVSGFCSAVMTSWHRNVFHNTGPFCGESTGPLWGKFPPQGASAAELWYIFVVSLRTLLSYYWVAIYLKRPEPHITSP